MNSIRLRIIKTEGESPFRVQISIDGLLFLLLKSYKEFGDAMNHARELEHTIRNAWKTPKVDHVMWETEI